MRKSTERKINCHQRKISNRSWIQKTVTGRLFIIHCWEICFKILFIREIPNLVILWGGSVDVLHCLYFGEAKFKRFLFVKVSTCTMAWILVILFPQDLVFHIIYVVMKYPIKLIYTNIFLILLYSFLKRNNWP